MPLIQNFSWIIYEIASATFSMFTNAFNSEFSWIIYEIASATFSMFTNAFNSEF